jgi:ABC-2 type transport system permease protein
MRNALAITRKELLELLLAPLFYVLQAANLLLMGLFFFLMVYQQTEAYFKEFFYWQTVLLLFFVPLLAMGQFAQERRQGTLDLLRVTRLSETALYAGKWLALNLAGVLLFLPTLVFPWLLSRHLALDWGAIGAGYAGLLLLLPLFSGISLLFSIGTDQPLLAATAGFGVLLVLLFVNFLANLLPPPLGPGLEYFSIYGQLEDFLDGLIDLRRVVFFASGALASGLLGLFALFGLRGEESGLGRRMLGSGHRLVASLGVIGIFLVGNALVSTQIYRWDWTLQGRNSLSGTTLETLGRLDAAGEDLRLLCFPDPGLNRYQREQQKRLIAEYDARSRRLSTKLYDLDARPALAERYGLAYPGQCVLETPAGIYHVGAIEEAFLTGTLRRYLRGGETHVVFTQGHGEPRPLAAEPEGTGTMTAASRQLKALGYQVRTTVLYLAEQFPELCDVLIVAGPGMNFLPEEKDMLRVYLERGGSALFLLDPPPAPSFADILSPLGFQIGDDLVVEGVSHMPGEPLTLIIGRYYTHPITATLGNAVLPVARSVGVAAKAPPGCTLQPLAETSEQSFAELDPSTVSFDPDSDIPGPIPVMACLRREWGAGRQSRVVVVGDSHFARDGNVQALSNLSLFVNAVTWLAEGETVADLPTRVRVARLVLPDRVLLPLLVVSLFAIPAVPLLIWVPVWMVKRRR